MNLLSYTWKTAKVLCLVLPAFFAYGAATLAAEGHAEWRELLAWGLCLCLAVLVAMAIHRGRRLYALGMSAGRQLIHNYAQDGLPDDTKYDRMSAEIRDNWRGERSVTVRHMGLLRYINIRFTK